MKIDDTKFNLLQLSIKEFGNYILFSDKQYNLEDMGMSIIPAKKMTITVKASSWLPTIILKSYDTRSRGGVALVISSKR